jgi:hypothetical protein
MTKEDRAVDLRPRSAGEVLDDAWRLALADAPLLLLFSALFLVPAFALLLLLLISPAPAGGRQLLLPALTALLLPLTGLGSGACQELFRRRAEDRPVGAGACLGSALRHGLSHAAARAVVLCAVAAGLVLLVMPGLTLWIAATPVHALIAAGRARTGGLWRELGREAAGDPAKAALVTLGRLPLLLVAALNLHLLAGALLWTAESLAGFDTALFGVSMSFLGNPVYTVGLLMLCWVLLAPYFEAANFLLHLDNRTRQEGLDLFFRVQRIFAAAGAGGVVRAGTLLLAAAGLLLAWGSAVAQEPAEPADHPALPSPARVKSLLRQRARQRPTAAAHPAEKPTERRKPPVEDDEPAPRTRPGGQGGGSPSRGFDVPLGGPAGWAVLAGLAVAVLGVAAYLFLTHRGGQRPVRPPTVQPDRPPEGPDLPRPDEQTPAELWRQALALAAAGQHRAALRLLYVAVLFLLDRQRLVQYEATRTNGEYLRQVRLAEHAPAALHAPFEQLTTVFETRWYGDGPCAAADFEAAQRLAEEVRACAQPA